MTVALDEIGVQVCLVEDDDGIAEPGLPLEPAVLRALTQNSTQADCDLLITRPERFKHYSQSRMVSGLMVFEAAHWPKEWVTMAQTALDFVIVPSEFCRAGLVGSGLPRERVCIVPHGVDTRVFHKAVNSAHDDLSKSGLIRTLFFGTPSRRKGLELLVGTILELPAALRTQILLTVKTETWPKRPDGEASLGMLLEALRESGVSVTHVREFLDERALADLMRMQDVACFPHYGEGFGMGILESMACGLSSIATDWSGPRDFFDSTCGWPVSPGEQTPAAEFLPDSFPRDDAAWMRGPDQSLFRAALIEAVTCPDLRREKGQAASDRAAAFSWKSAAEQFCICIEEMNQCGAVGWLGKRTI